MGDEPNTWPNLVHTRRRPSNQCNITLATRCEPHNNSNSSHIYPIHTNSNAFRSLAESKTGTPNFNKDRRTKRNTAKNQGVETIHLDHSYMGSNSMGGRSDNTNMDTRPRHQ